MKEFCARVRKNCKNCNYSLLPYFFYSYVEWVLAVFAVFARKFWRGIEENLTMKVELRNLSDIKPYENNPRHNDNAVAAVATSIREFGFRQPIVVDAEGVIVVGHARYKAALQLGLEKVPVHVATDLTPEQIKAYRIADNKTAELSDWNYELLPIELSELKAYDFNLDLLGFTQVELAELFGEKAPEKYTSLIRGLIYEPRMTDPPAISQLYNDAKLQLLLPRIESAKLPPELEYFFRLAAHRFVRFRFDLIAEYYAHASEDIRQIMRELVLVIVDYDDAIAAGVLKLSEKIINLINEANQKDE